MDVLILLAAMSVVAAFSFWCGWDIRGDVEFNKRHGIKDDA
jgi:hypothetical protein